MKAFITLIAGCTLVTSIASAHTRRGWHISECATYHSPICETEIATVVAGRTHEHAGTGEREHSR